MIEEILPSIFRVEVPLPRNPLKALNSYMLKGRERNLIIDTGMNRDECKEASYSALRELEIDLERTDFFITHLHADHSGLVSTLATSSSVVYCSQADARSINSGGAWANQRSFARMSGFPEEQLQEAIDRHPGNRYRSSGQVDFTILKEGDTLEVGEYLFNCVETPGHTSGHICLYEAGKKILVAGDHVLGNITPNIALWSDERNPLEEYLASLDKVCELDVQLALPGHRSLITNFEERVQQLKRHHQARADEVLSILEKGPQNGYQVASQMTWDLTYKSWDLFPVSQKWFASGEAISHLKFLEERGLIQRETRDQGIVYSRT